MNIRSAKKSDAADIARIHVETWRVAYAGIVSGSHLASLDQEDRARKWAKTLASANDNTRVAVLKNGSIVGWASFGPSRDDDGQGNGELYAIYLDHAYWNRGIGKQLMDDALLHLKRNGFDRVTLWVLEENHRTRKFYEKVGFLHDGKSKTIVIDDEELIELRYQNMVQQCDPEEVSCFQQ